jgi:hypothetical protein
VCNDLASRSGQSAARLRFLVLPALALQQPHLELGAQAGMHQKAKACVVESGATANRAGYGLKAPESFFCLKSRKDMPQATSTSSNWCWAFGFFFESLAFFGFTFLSSARGKQGSQDQERIDSLFCFSGPPSCPWSSRLKKTRAWGKIENALPTSRQCQSEARRRLVLSRPLSQPKQHSERSCHRAALQQREGELQFPRECRPALDASKKGTADQTQLREDPFPEIERQTCRALRAQARRARRDQKQQKLSAQSLSGREVQNLLFRAEPRA